jgi:hypothetical protein
MPWCLQTKSISGDAATRYVAESRTHWQWRIESEVVVVLALPLVDGSSGFRFFDRLPRSPQHPRGASQHLQRKVIQKIMDNKISWFL